MGYFLDERRGWSFSIEELRRALQEAREEGKLVRGLVFINPGNPTGESGAGGEAPPGWCWAVDQLHFA